MKWGSIVELLVVSLNYQKAPVEIREKFSFQESELEHAMASLKEKQSILENVIISTCNRTEVYAIVDDIRRGEDYMKRFLAEWFHLSIEEFVPYLVIYQKMDVVKHLMRVTCGLESLIVGETQILGQVRSSFLKAQAKSTTGLILNTLFKQAVTLGKRAHTDTNIGTKPVSVSYAAVQLGKQVLPSFATSHGVIIGAGKMGEIAAKHMTSQKIGQLTIVNRTFEKAKELAEKYHGTAILIENLEVALLDADIVISATGAKDFIITEEMMRRVKEKRKKQQLLIADIAVPRDIDAAVRSIDDVFLYDIDDFHGMIESNLEERASEGRKIEAMIEQSVEEFEHWLVTLEATPVIAALREKSMDIQMKTMQSIERKLPSLSERERKVVNKLTKSLVNQILRNPIITAKEMANEPMAKIKLQIFREIFQIEEIEENKSSAAREQSEGIT